MGEVVWDQIIGAALTGIAGVITAVAGLMATRRRSDEGELAWCEEERLAAQDRLLIALRHVFLLERTLAATGGDVPPRPEALQA